MEATKRARGEPAPEARRSAGRRVDTKRSREMSDEIFALMDEDSSGTLDVFEVADHMKLLHEAGVPPIHTPTVPISTVTFGPSPPSRQ